MVLFGDRISSDDLTPSRLTRSILADIALCMDLLMADFIGVNVIGVR